MWPKRRIERCGPSTASGGMITLTGIHSARRASTMGDDSSTCRPMSETILSMICIRCALSLNLMLVSSNIPARSMYTRLCPFTRMSLMVDPAAAAPGGPIRRLHPTLLEISVAVPGRSSGFASSRPILDNGQSLCPGALVPHQLLPAPVHFIQEVAMYGRFQLLIDLEVQTGLSFFVARRMALMGPEEAVIWLNSVMVYSSDRKLLSTPHPRMPRLFLLSSAEGFCLWFQPIR